MKKIFIKKVLSATLICLFFLQAMYFVLEPSLASAVTTMSDDVIVTLNVTAGITISNGADATMAPNIGIGANKSVGSSSWTVATNNSLGYTLAVKASTTPALAKGAPSADSFTDYTNVGGVPDLWGGVPSAGKEFGFSARGTDSLAAYGSPTTCGNTGTGAPDVAAKYKGFTTSDQTIATSSAVTPFAGTLTYICFAAEQGATTYAASGTYTATITGTATVI